MVFLPTSGLPLRIAAASAVGLLYSVLAMGQSTQPAPSLAQRQADIQQRWQRLEGIFLKLADTLAETEPEQAERLRDAQELAGRQQVRGRIETLVTLLRTMDATAGEQRDGARDDADRQQKQLILDLQILLQALVRTESELDRLRAERERLEGFKREIRRLQEDQIDQLRQAQALAEQADAEAEGQADSQPATSQPTTSQPVPGSREAAAAQKELRERAADVAQRMEASKGKEPTPGTPAMQQAGERMQAATEKLESGEPQQATEEQQQAAQAMQRALDELEDALRQVRREEQEETLANLESRLRSMLERQRSVREAVSAVSAAPPSEWNETQRLQVSQAATQQAQLAEDCGGLLRLLEDDGTTVIVPELVGQVSEDMRQLAQRLASSLADAQSLALADDIIALLEEILSAVSKQRDRPDEPPPPQPPGDQPPPEGQDQPLLPNSAELKLLRAAQLRINTRTAALAADEQSPAALQALAVLSARQARLSELTIRMHERSP